MVEIFGIIILILIVIAIVCLEALAEYWRTGKWPTHLQDKGFTPLDKEWWD